MIDVEDIVVTDKLSKEEIIRRVNLLNDFFFNPNEKQLFQGDVTLLDSLTSIKEDGVLLYTSKSEYYKVYLQLSFALKRIQENIFSDVRETIYTVIKNSSFFITNDLLEKIYTKYEDLIEPFTEKEKEILRDYKGGSKFFHIDEDDNLTRNNLVAMFWRNYFLKHITHQEMKYLLKHNIRKFEKILEDNDLTINNFSYLKDYKNKIFEYPLSEHLSYVFKLNKDEKNILNILFLERSLEVVIEHIRNISEDEPSHHNIGLNFAYSNLIDEFYGLKKGSVYNFISKKIFIDQEIFKENVRVDTASYISIYDLLGENHFFTLKVDSSLDEVIKKYIPFEINNSTLSINDFSYMGKNVDMLKSVLLQKEPKDILLWGSPGFGKTQMVKTLSKSLDLEIFSVAEKKITSTKRFNLISVAKDVKKFTDNFIILIDEAEDILKGKDYKSILTQELENKQVHTFWIINHIDDIPEAFLRRFDYIMEINEMPMNKRVELANKLLKDNADESLAYKIAQAIHTPAEIESAINWCHATEDYSWANISNKIINYQKAIASSIKNELGNFTIEVITPSQNCSLKDFAGYEYIKNEAKDILDIFSHPEKYNKVGAKVPKGVLLAGMPGVGKTMFTKCLASQLSTTLITASSSALATNPDRIKMLFEKAKSQAPCIVFIDEIDVLGSKVTNHVGDINTEKQKILNQLLIELDGFHSFSGVMVIGATHRAELLDAALTRSGRFGKTIYFREPSLEDRKEIIKYYCEKIKISNHINYSQLARLSAAFTSADISMAINDAAILAARKNQEEVTQKDLEQSIDEVYFGANLNGLPITPLENWKTAIHEAGHALVAIKVGQIPQRATTKPHLQFMGLVQLQEYEGNYSQNFSQIKDNIQISIAGLVAEEIIFSEHTNGADSDLYAIHDYVFKAIKKSGMSKTLGAMTVGATITISNSLLEKIETEAKTIIEEARITTTDWLKIHKKQLIDFAKLLHEERSLDEDTMKDWFKENVLKQDKENKDMDIQSLIEAAYKTV